MKNTDMKSAITLLNAGLLTVLTGCQSIQSYNGQTGYQRLSGNSQPLVISYTMDSKTTDTALQKKLQKACAQELGLTTHTSVKVNIVNQKEFARPTPQDEVNSSKNSIALGNSSRTSFGLSATPRLSNNSNPANLDMLNTRPQVLKQVTAECSS
ncbi:hypothetical protein ACF3NA_03805 [Alkanindiges sp. WGS2144]|uniref:hypothetical protein n=1 Tax=Alkanindiges sp. WGS2144 TaxID=3366808 RepID=UPI0037512747